MTLLSNIDICNGTRGQPAAQQLGCARPALVHCSGRKFEPYGFRSRASRRVLRVTVKTCKYVQEGSG